GAAGVWCQSCQRSGTPWAAALPATAGPNAREPAAASAPRPDGRRTRPDLIRSDAIRKPPRAERGTVVGRKSPQLRDPTQAVGQSSGPSRRRPFRSDSPELIRCANIQHNKCFWEDQMMRIAQGLAGALAASFLALAPLG